MAGNESVGEERRGSIVIAADEARGRAQRLVVKMAQSGGNVAFDEGEYLASLLVGAEPARDFGEARRLELAEQRANERDIAARRAPDRVPDAHHLLHQAAAKADFATGHAYSPASRLSCPMDGGKQSGGTEDSLTPKRGRY